MESVLLHMPALLLSDPLNAALTGLAPLIILPVAIVVGGITIPAIRYLSRRPGFGTYLLLFLLGLLNLWFGLAFIGITRDAFVHSNYEYRQHNWPWAAFGFACYAVMGAAGGFAVWKVIYSIYTRLAKALKDRMG